MADHHYRMRGPDFPSSNHHHHYHQNNSDGGGGAAAVAVGSANAAAQVGAAGGIPPQTQPQHQHQQQSVTTERGVPDAQGFITDPRDSDVLCGRGGAALRHPGNQTYRRLVNLNKGLYITCLKTEKLKISRSIVAAIREQKGRFLEKDANQNAWYDIGDKKAVEKTSQALREGQPKLRQKIVEMGAVAANQYENELASGDYDAVTTNTPSFDQQQQHQQQFALQELMPPPSQPHSQMHQQQQQQHQILRQQQELLKQHHQQQQQQQDIDRHHHLTNLLDATGVGGGNSSTNSGLLRSSSTSIGRHDELQAMQPPSSISPLAVTTSITGMASSSSQDLHAELLRRLSLHDLHTAVTAAGEVNQQQQQQLQQQQQQRSMSSSGTVPNQFQQRQPLNPHEQQQQQQLLLQHHQQQQQQQQQLYEQQQQQRNRLRPSLNTRASIARELGIAESQLSLMSEFSAFGGSISATSGLGSIAMANTSASGSLLANTSGSFLMNNNPTSSSSSGPLMMNTTTSSGPPLMATNTTEGLANSISDIQGLMSIDSSFKRALMGLPIGSLHTLQTNDGLSLDNASMSTGGSTSIRYGGASPAAAAAAAAAAVNNANNFDRRRVFAKMKYTRPPSERKAPPAGQSIAGGSTAEELSDFQFLESNMSLYSNVSNLTGIDSRTTQYTVAAAPPPQPQWKAIPVTTTTPNHPTHHHNAMSVPTMPSNHLNTGASKVMVETAKVIDHSSISNRTSSYFGDAMSTGSRNSIMSGLSRISDSSIDHSIFSDLSKKIGNVSTRSMAMSEMSAFEIQERDNDDDNSGSNTNGDVVDPNSGFDEAQLRKHLQAMEFDL